MNDIIKVLEKQILKIYDENGIEIPFTKKEIKFYKAKFSSSSPALTLFLDEVPLLNNRKYNRKVEYSCKCGNINTILLCKYLKKESMGCPKCRENDEKIKWHKLYFEKKRNGEIRGNKKRRTVTYNFDAESDEFKEAYFKRNITIKEFDSIKKYIYSVSNIILENKKVKFLIAEPSFNSKKYRQMLDIDGVIVPFKDIYLRCPLCNKVFHITRQIKERVEAHNFDCKKCFLNNKTFAIKKVNNVLNYQGKLELNFIEKCFDKNILIENGPTIEYFFNEKRKLYTIDFYLPEYDIYIEIKDNHIWHKKQVESGRWKAKEEAAIRYSKQNNKMFYLLFPKDIECFFKTLEKK